MYQAACFLSSLGLSWLKDYMIPLQDLTLLNKFLFDEAMDIPEAHEAALQIILQQDDLWLLAPA